MQLKDVTPIIKEILKERDKNPLVINTERYIPCYKPNQYGNAVRAGLRKSLRIIEQSPAIDAVPVVRCYQCKHVTYDWITGNLLCARNRKVEGNIVYGGFLVDKYDYCSFGVKSGLEE